MKRPSTRLPRELTHNLWTMLDEKYHGMGLTWSPQGKSIIVDKTQF